MGALGALAGAGQGFQDYSKLMGEKRTLDWKSKQAELQHERERNLEMLRASNQSKLADKNIEATSALADKRIGANSSLADKNIAANSALADKNIEARSALAKEGFQNQLTLEEIREKNKKEGREEELNFELDKAEKVSNLTSKLKRQEIEKEWSSFTETPTYKKMSPEQKEIAELRMRHPVAYKLISGTEAKDSDKIDAARLYAAEVRAAEEQYDTLSKKDKRKIDSKIPKGEDPRSYFSSAYANQQMQRAGLGKFIGLEPTGTQPSGLLKKDVLRTIVDGVNNNEVSLDKVEKKYGTVAKQQVEEAIAASSQTDSGYQNEFKNVNPEMPGSALDSAGPIGGRNKGTPQGYQLELGFMQDIKRNNALREQRRQGR